MANKIDDFDKTQIGPALKNQGWAILVSTLDSDNRCITGIIFQGAD